MRKRRGEAHFGERADQLVAGREVDHAVVSGASAQLGRVLLGEAFNEHSLARSHHALAYGTRLRVELGLQPREPFGFLERRNAVRQIRCRSTGPRAVDEAESAVEFKLGGKAQAGGEIRLALAGKADDEIRGEAELGAGLLQPARDRAVLERRVAALHRREHAVGTRLYRKVNVRR